MPNSLLNFVLWWSSLRKTIKSIWSHVTYINNVDMSVKPGGRFLPLSGMTHGGRLGNASAYRMCCKSTHAHIYSWILAVVWWHLRKVEWFMGQNWHLMTPRSAQVSRNAFTRCRRFRKCCLWHAESVLWSKCDFLAVCVTLPSCFIQSHHHLHVASQTLFRMHLLNEFLQQRMPFTWPIAIKGFPLWNAPSAVYWIYLAPSVSL